jgi:hypothetical protein
MSLSSGTHTHEPPSKVCAGVTGGAGRQGAGGGGVRLVGAEWPGERAGLSGWPRNPRAYRGCPARSPGANALEPVAHAARHAVGGVVQRRTAPGAQSGPARTGVPLGRGGAPARHAPRPRHGGALRRRRTADAHTPAHRVPHFKSGAVVGQRWRPVHRRRRAPRPFRAPTRAPPPHTFGPWGALATAGLGGRWQDASPRWQRDAAARDVPGVLCDSPPWCPARRARVERGWAGARGAGRSAGEGGRGRGDGRGGRRHARRAPAGGARDTGRGSWPRSGRW